MKQRFCRLKQEVREAKEALANADEILKRTGRVVPPLTELQRRVDELLSRFPRLHTRRGMDQIINEHPKRPKTANEIHCRTWTRFTHNMSAYLIERIPHHPAVMNLSSGAIAVRERKEAWEQLASEINAKFSVEMNCRV